MTRHLLGVDDLTNADVADLVERSVAIKARPKDYADLLQGRSLLMLFAKPSMRTRISFEVAMTELGGHAIAYDLRDSTVGRKETLRDFGAVASRYAHAIVARLGPQSDLRELASRATVPVINGLTDHEHPCQAIADLVTMSEKADLRRATLAYVGDARNNVMHSLLIAAAKTGLSVRVACPADMTPDERVLARAREIARGTAAAIDVGHDPRTAVRGATFVYTDTWMSYHVPEELRAARTRALEPFRVDASLMAASRGAYFMHCLPATRGEEVTDDVLDSARSLVLDQAENRVHAQKAILVALMRPTLSHAWPAGAPLPGS